MAALAAFALQALCLQAQVTPVGHEIQVNSYTTENQLSPAVAEDLAGTLVVVWTGEGSAGTDTDLQSIHARRYDASGEPLDVEFQVNSYTTSEQMNGRIAVDDQGRFIVVWQSDGSNGSDHSGRSVQAQRYDADGNPLGGEFQVNSLTTAEQASPDIATDASGGFVVVWHSSVSGGTDTSEFSIQGQRYDPSGAPVGGEFQVNSYTSSSQMNPRIAFGAQGRFLVAWESYGSAGTDTSSWSIQARLFEGDGTPVGDDFQVNTYTTLYQFRPSVAGAALGNFVVAWDSPGSFGSDSSSSSIQAQRFDVAGNPVGGEFQVNAVTTSVQTRPAVATEPDGGFVIAWQSWVSMGSDSSSYSIQAQRFDATGMPAGLQFQVNSYTTNYQNLAALAEDGRGNFVISWTSYGSGGNDSDGLSIQAQRFRESFFYDGFETGDTSRWSNVVP